MPPKNIGIAERKSRLVIGLILLLVSIISFVVFNQPIIALVFFIVAFVPLFTSATGTCPLYCATGRSTNNS